MKKAIGISVLVLFLFSGCFAKAEINLSSLSDDELIRLYVDVSSQFSERNLVFRRKLEEGVYTVGIDLPQGLYYVYPAYSATFSTYKEDNAPAFRWSEYFLFPHSEPFLFEFFDETIIMLESGTLTLVSCVDGYGRSWLNMSPDAIRSFSVGE